MEFNSRALRNGNVPNYYKVVRFLRVNVGLLTVVFSLECTRITSVHFVVPFLTDFKKEMEVVNSIVILFLLKRLQASLRSHLHHGRYLESQKLANPQIWGVRSQYCDLSIEATWRWLGEGIITLNIPKEKIIDKHESMNWKVRNQYFLHAPNRYLKQYLDVGRVKN